jgi:6-pyruvoyltetrahydropterin/6-carboxytetrahydropterin synthase
MPPSHFGSVIAASRYHDFSAGHRVYGHENKCALLHGHNYRVHFKVVVDHLDDVGRVIDFSVINRQLCQWLESNWDHKMLLWDNDPLSTVLLNLDGWEEPGVMHQALQDVYGSIHSVSFNPTAENMAQYLLRTVGPMQLAGTGTVLHEVTVWETRKCYTTATLNWNPPVTYTTDDTMSMKFEEPEEGTF